MAEGGSSASTHLLAAAFDFGTTYSGYAFSFRYDPMKIQTNSGWNAGSEQLISLKTPTCVLLDRERKFHSFGFEAENHYSELCEDDDHRGWLLFQRFKMILHNNQGLTRESTVKDINGIEMPAMEIFAMAISFLQGHLLKRLNAQLVGLEEDNIMYTITIPAIWNDNAKQFMREAAIKAGLDQCRLKLALEPEAASIWCQTIRTELGDSLSVLNTKYMVVDLGGGTADVSVHEKKADGTLKEVHKASGGPWGGIVVDKNYLNWLSNLLGKPTLDIFKKEHMADYFDLLREFETKKRIINYDSQKKVTFRVSTSLREVYKKIEKSELEEKFAAMKLNDKVSFKGDKLRVDADIVRSWFEHPIRKCVNHVKRLLAEPDVKNVRRILLVGGFGSCEIVRQEFEKAMGSRQLICPNEAGLAVLKGAVIYGHTPKIISSRIMKYTYGTNVCRQIEQQNELVESDAYDSSDDQECISEFKWFDDDHFDWQSNFVTLSVNCDDDGSDESISDEFSFAHQDSLPSESDQRDSSSEDEEDFDERISHDEEGNAYWTDKFDAFVKMGEEITLGHKVTREYKPLQPGDATDIDIYSTLDQDPDSVKDEGCKLLGVLTVEHPDGETVQDKAYKVTMIFGDTEIKVKAKIMTTGRKFTTTINCLK